MQTIGLTNIDPWFALDDSSLKSDLIYFDKLYFTISNRQNLEKFCYSLPNGKKAFEEKLKEIELLQNSGLISEYTEEQYQTDKSVLHPKEILKYFEKAHELSSSFSTKDKTFEESFIDFLGRFREVGQLDVRIKSTILNSKYDDHFIPILRNKYHSFQDAELSPTSKVLSVLIKKFPNISNQTNLQDFITFKSDPDTTLKLARLRDWTLEISKKNYSEKEIEQKIEYLLSEYSKQIEIHKLKYDIGTIETFVTTTLEVLENTIKLNFSKAAKTIFEIGNRDINLLEAEQKLMGKELALIHDLNTKNRI